MKIEAGTVYEHDECSQVVVLGVHRVFQTYETDIHEGELDSVVVRWADEWDGFGALWGHSRSETLNAFLTAVGDPIENINFITPEQ